MNILKTFWDWKESAWERFLTVDWLRRAFFVVVALLIAAYPPYLVWKFGVAYAFDWGSVVQEVVFGAFFLTGLLVLGAVGLPMIDVPRSHGLVALVPFVGVPFLVLWAWRLGALWLSKEQRFEKREHLLEGLDAIEREVFRLRMDPEEDHFYSRKRAARELGISTERLIEAEKRIAERWESMVGADAS